MTWGTWSLIYRNLSSSSLGEEERGYLPLPCVLLRLIAFFFKKDEKRVWKERTTPLGIDGGGNPILDSGVQNYVTQLSCVLIIIGYRSSDKFQWLHCDHFCLLSGTVSMGYALLHGFFPYFSIICSDAIWICIPVLKYGSRKGCCDLRYQYRLVCEKISRVIVDCALKRLHDPRVLSIKNTTLI